MVGRVGDYFGVDPERATPKMLADAKDPHNNPAGPKYDAGKLRWSLLPMGTVIQIVKVLEFGAQKYHKESWKQVPEGRERYYNATKRHLEAWWTGERLDPETGLHHLAHAACNLLFLIWKDDNEQNP